jgi:hypothetical protein
MPLGRWQLSKLRAIKNPARKSKGDGAEYNPRSELRFVRLENIPIANACHEKRIFEKGEFARKLNPEYYSGVVAESEDMRHKRIVEVYKRCFEATEPRKRPKVLRDFAAHFPNLVLDADWIKELVRRDFATSKFSNDSREVFRAIANGFRSAASTKPREPAFQKSYKLSSIRLFVDKIQGELEKWNEDLERGISLMATIAASATVKAEELAKTYGQLARRDDVRRLTKLLKQGHCYEAAIFIGARVYRVRERDLESRSE